MITIKRCVALALVASLAAGAMVQPMKPNPLHCALCGWPEWRLPIVLVVWRPTP